jgi:hypothetical protein
MTTITWKIADLVRKPTAGSLTDVVTTAHWRCEGSHESENGAVTTAAHYGTVDFQEPDQDGDFAPFSELTESTVIEWVKSALGAEAVAARETAIANNIQEQLNPPVLTGLPWA